MDSMNKLKDAKGQKRVELILQDRSSTAVLDAKPKKVSCMGKRNVELGNFALGGDYFAILRDNLYN